MDRPGSESVLILGNSQLPVIKLCRGEDDGTDMCFGEPRGGPRGGVEGEMGRGMDCHTSVLEVGSRVAPQAFMLRRYFISVCTLFLIFMGDDDDNDGSAKVGEMTDTKGSLIETTKTLPAFLSLSLLT